MNAPWQDPYRRELLIAAAAGLAWALLGFAIAAHGAEPASCRIHNHLPHNVTNIGSGTLVDVTADRRRGLVLTCAHLFTAGRGRVIVEFANGRTHGANVLAVDPDADLAALEIADPQASPAPLGIDVDPQGALTACGFGPAGQFRCIAGRVIGTAQGTGQLSVQITGAVRSGDSGGVFDQQGRLVAVVWGESGGVTYASTGGPLRRFLERVLGKRIVPGRASGVSPLPTSPLASSPVCPNGRCPLLQAAPFETDPINREPASVNCHCGDQLAAIAARLDAIENGKQDRGDYLTPGALAGLARSDDVALFEQHTRAPSILVERIENSPSPRRRRSRRAVGDNRPRHQRPPRLGVLAAIPRRRASAGGCEGSRLR
jgi:hypothetical protein